MDKTLYGLAADDVAKCIYTENIYYEPRSVVLDL